MLRGCAEAPNILRWSEKENSKVNFLWHDLHCRHIMYNNLIRYTRKKHDDWPSKRAEMTKPRVLDLRKFPEENMILEGWLSFQTIAQQSKRKETLNLSGAWSSMLGTILLVQIHGMQARPEASRSWRSYQHLSNGFLQVQSSRTSIVSSQVGLRWQLRRQLIRVSQDTDEAATSMNGVVRGRATSVKGQFRG